MQIQFGAAKVAKYATRESGDTLELIERPHGGYSAVLVDGQRSGRSAKIISNIVARKAVSLIGEGVRDGAVARATHDYLRTHRRGQVSAELLILSADFATQTLVISRNSHCPCILYQNGEVRVLDGPSQVLGIYARTKPIIVEMPLEASTYVVAYTDGMMEAGRAASGSLNLPSLIAAECAHGPSAQELADLLLMRALEADEHRPHDDMSVVTLAVLSSPITFGVRRMSLSVPLDVLAAP
ncbi:MAG: PP2C family protein-serine/threonine phosphatase [Anaerolineae bacterium]